MKLIDFPCPFPFISDGEVSLNIGLADSSIRGFRLRFCCPEKPVIRLIVSTASYRLPSGMNLESSTIDSLLHGIIDVPATGRTVIPCVLVMLGFAASTPAEKVYRWQDANGQIHYGDIPPKMKPAERREIKSTSPPADSSAGLRPGERKVLHRIERREHDAHRDRSRIRLRNDKRRAAKRRDCAEIRKHLRQTRDKKLRKQYSNTLRRDC